MGVGPHPQLAEREAAEPFAQESPCEQRQDMDVDWDEEETEAQKPYAENRRHATVKAERSQRKKEIAAQTDEKSDTPKRPRLRRAGTRIGGGLPELEVGPTGGEKAPAHGDRQAAARVVLQQ